MQSFVKDWRPNCLEGEITTQELSAQPTDDKPRRDKYQSDQQSEPAEAPEGDEGGCPDTSIGICANATTSGSPLSIDSLALNILSVSSTPDMRIEAILRRAWWPASKRT